MKRLLFLVCVVGITLQGCAEPKPRILGAPIEGYSHTSAAINRFSVNGNGGPNLSPYGYNGGQMCCVALPVKWRPDLTVVVEWEKDPDPHAYVNWPKPRFSDAWREAAKEHKKNYTRHSVIAPVARYEELGLVNVHFLPCNQVAVSAGATYPGRPDYPFHFPQKMDEPQTCPKP